MILKNGKRLDGCSDTVPIGTLNPYIGSVAPYGYLICEGQLVSKTTYKELYEICGDTFGTGTATEFRLPDLKGKTIVGYKEGDSTFGTLGGLLGSLTHTHTTGNHTLTIDEMPGHTHARGTMEITGTFGITTRYNSVDMNSRTSGAFKFNHEDGKAAEWAQSNPYDEGGSVSFKASDSWTGDSSWNGGSQAHNHGNTGESLNLQPSLTMNWIVKAFLLMPNQSYVENNLTSSSETNALSAAKGKELNDKFDNYVLINNIVNNVTSTDTKKPLSANQGKVLNDKFSNYILTSNIVNNVTSTDTNKPLSANQGKVLNDKINNLSIPSVNNTLTSTSTTQALSAAQGKALNDKIDSEVKLLWAGTAFRGSTITVDISKYKLIGLEFLCVNPGGTSSYTTKYIHWFYNAESTGQYGGMIKTMGGVFYQYEVQRKNATTFYMDYVAYANQTNMNSWTVMQTGGQSFYLATVIGVKCS